jgi:hypothetical protein
MKLNSICINKISNFISQSFINNKIANIRFNTFVINVCLTKSSDLNSLLTYKLRLLILQNQKINLVTC